MSRQSDHVCSLRQVCPGKRRHTTKNSHTIHTLLTQVEAFQRTRDYWATLRLICTDYGQTKRLREKRYRTKRYRTKRYRTTRVASPAVERGRHCADPRGVCACRPSNARPGSQMRLLHGQRSETRSSTVRMCPSYGDERASPEIWHARSLTTRAASDRLSAHYTCAAMGSALAVCPAGLRSRNRSQRLQRRIVP